MLSIWPPLEAVNAFRVEIIQRWNQGSRGSWSLGIYYPLCLTVTCFLPVCSHEAVFPHVPLAVRICPSPQGEQLCTKILEAVSQDQPFFSYVVLLGTLIRGANKCKEYVF